MNKQEFWEILQNAHQQANGDMDENSRLIKTFISNLDHTQTIAFAEHFDQAMDALYSWPLWGAAYVINGGCGDDSFADFRSSLIAKGKKAFDIACSNPDHLVELDYPTDLWFYEGFTYTLNEAVTSKLGNTPKRYQPMPTDPSGQEWQEDVKTLSLLYPLLWQKYSHIWSTESATESSTTTRKKAPDSKPVKKPWWKFW